LLHLILDKTGLVETDPVHTKIASVSLK